MINYFLQAKNSPAFQQLGSLGLTLAAGVILISQPFRALGQTCVSPPAGLVAWWAGDGNANDDVGGKTGTLLNGVTFSPGEVYQAFNLSGGSHIRIPDASDLHFTNVTIEAWVYPTAHGTYHEIVSKWNASGSGAASYDLTLHPDGRTYIAISTDGYNVAAFAISTNAIALNTWTFLAGTFDGSAARIYVNGGFQNSSVSPGGIFPGTGDLGIGGTVGGVSAGQAAYPFAGKIDEVSLYNRALSGAEIQQIYNAGSLGKCNSTVAPSILSPPVNQIVHVGFQVAFQVAASGRPLHYQWQFNHLDIAAATNNTLVLSNVQTNQAGIYSVIVSNSAGIAPSPDVTLQVLTNCISAAAGIVAWWPGDGDATDHFGNNHATLNGGLGFAPGEAGLAFSLDGIDDYMSVPASQTVDIGQGDGLTIEGWIKPSDLSASHTIAEWNSGAGNIGVHVDHSNPGIGGLGSVFADLVDVNGGSHVIASSSGILTTNAFQHIAVAYNRTNGTAKIYRNGVVVSSQSFGSFRPQTTFPLTFGSRVSGSFSGQFYSGSMDEIALYNRALTDSEIQDIVNAGSSGKNCIAPEVLTQPQSRRVKPGTNVTFTVTVRGKAPLSYQWRFNGLDISAATNSALILSNVQPSTAGDYSVRITNALGSATSSNANLKVDVVLAFGNGQPLTNSQMSFPGPVTIQLQNVYTNGYIFYTLDGSPPSFGSAQYAAPFVVTQNVTLRALGYSADFLQSGELDPVSIMLPPVFTLTASTAGGGTISMSPPGGSYISNTTVTVTAVPGSGWMFLQWLGDAIGTNSSTNLVMSRSKSIRAVFGTTLGTTIAGAGSVTMSPPGGIYPYGTIAWLSAVPQSGNRFALWGNAASGSANPLSFGITNPNPTVSSLFAAISAGQAALTVVPVGNGRISTDPTANVYNVGSSVTITATPDPGQTFSGWSGDANGTQNPLLISVTTNMLVYANFTHRPSLSASAAYEGSKPEGFVFTVVGDYGGRYEIDASTNLADWVKLTSLTNMYDTGQFLDSGAPNFPRRFYRAMVLP